MLELTHMMKMKREVINDIMRGNKSWLILERKKV